MTHGLDTTIKTRPDSYVLANFRAGVKGEKWFAEGWVRNAFNQRYVPIALPYPDLT